MQNCTVDCYQTVLLSHYYSYEVQSQLDESIVICAITLRYIMNVRGLPSFARWQQHRKQVLGTFRQYDAGCFKVILVTISASVTLFSQKNVIFSQHIAIEIF